MFLALGAQDLHLTLTGKIDFCIQCMLAAWKRKDPPVSCVKPIPIQILKRIAFVATKLPPTSNLLQATANMITTAFFFLLCSGEYTDLSSTDATPITLQMSNILHHQPSLLPLMLNYWKDILHCSPSHIRKTVLKMKSFV